jgi:hypothetical protein
VGERERVCVCVCVPRHLLSLSVCVRERESVCVCACVCVPRHFICVCGFCLGLKFEAPMSEHLTPASPAMRRTWSCDSRGPVRMEQQRAAAVALQVWWQLAPLAPRNHCALPCMRGGREWGSGRDRVTSQAGRNSLSRLCSPHHSVARTAKHVSTRTCLFLQPVRLAARQRSTAQRRRPGSARPAL